MNNQTIVIQRKTFVLGVLLCICLLVLGIISLGNYHPESIMSTKYSLHKGCIAEDSRIDNHLAYCNPILLTNGTWIDTTTNPAEKYLN